MLTFSIFLLSLHRVIKSKNRNRNCISMERVAEMRPSCFVMENPYFCMKVTKSHKG